MKKTISVIMAALLALCLLTSAVAQVTSDPSVGLSIDLPDDFNTRNVAIQPIDIGGSLVGLLFSYMDYDALAPYMEPLKDAAMSGDETAYTEAYAAYTAAAGQYTADCALIVGVPTDSAETLLPLLTDSTEDLEPIGSNSTHTYYKQFCLGAEELSDELRAAAEAELDYIAGLIDKTTVIEIEEASEEVSDEAAGALLQFSSVDMNGNPVDGSLFAQADLTVLNIWGTYCSPCIAEMPELAEWAKELPENVQLVGLIVDVPSADDKNFAKAQKILDKSGAGFVNILYNDSLAGLLSGITGTPTTLFLDSSGNQVAEAVVGAYFDKYKAAVEAFLAQ